MSVRSLLARIQRLEEARTSPWDRLVGPIEEFDAYVRDGIAAGKLDPKDAPVVLASVRSWIRQEM